MGNLFAGCAAVVRLKRDLLLVLARKNSNTLPRFADPPSREGFSLGRAADGRLKRDLSVDIVEEQQ